MRQSTRSEYYRSQLRNRGDWVSYLRAQSALPGPRAGLELADAVAEEGSRQLFLELLKQGPKQAPNGSPEEFLAFCGTIGLGKVIARGDRSVVTQLRALASDPRWRIREGVALALQRIGDEDIGFLLEEMRQWANGTPLERRAAAAALCEPRLLREPGVAKAVLRLLDRITATIPNARERRSDEFRSLRKTLGYCWSVAIVASPAEGKRLFEKWAASDHPDVQWIVEQNLRKRRLQRMDAEWVAGMWERLGVR